MLRVHVLGELLVERSGRPVEVAGSWRARSLLAWLALHPGPHPRGDLAARFWPDVLDSSARASLRNGLWALRRVLGDRCLSATRTHVGLAGTVWVDAAAFDEHAAAGRLDAALDLCRGPLLTGIDEEWVYEPRDAFRDRAAELLERKATAAADPGEAVAWTRRRVALDPFAEDGQRALMTRLAGTGDRAGALAAYARLRERLRRELGVAAMPETVALAEQIREGASHGGEAWAPGEAFPLPPRLRRAPSAAFAGRAAERAALRRHWAEVRAARGARIVVVTGEPGIGKSRLVREIALEAHEGGAVVLHGSADEDLLVPHQHLVEALGHYLEVAAPSELRRLVEPRAEDLAPIVPRAVAPTAPAHQPSESRRYRLFEAVGGLLDDLAAGAPVLLVLDDLQWADHATTALLRHVLESRPEMALLVLATARPAEPGAAHAAPLTRLAQQRIVERIALEGLDDSDVAGMSRSLTGRELPAALLRAIRAEAGGNPFFVQEMIRHLSEAGGVLSLARADVPEGIRDVVNLRLARLAEPCVRLLTVAAVIGAHFDLAPLEQVSDLQGEDLAAALDDLLATDLIAETRHGDHEELTFAHALVRRTLLARLSPARRRRIHARVAEALIALRGDAALLEIAHHLCEALPATDRDRALDYATRAAEKATRDLAYAEAVDLFTRARSLLEPTDVRRRILTLKRAIAYQALYHVVYDSQSTTSPGLMSPTIS